MISPLQFGFILLLLVFCKDIGLFGVLSGKRRKLDFSSMKSRSYWAAWIGIFAIIYYGHRMSIANPTATMSEAGSDMVGFSLIIALGVAAIAYHEIIANHMTIERKSREYANDTSYDKDGVHVIRDGKLVNIMEAF